MAKRIADTQITSDFPEEQDDTTERNEPVIASAQVMAKRKILTPKGGLGNGSNPFKGILNGFKGLKPVAAPAPAQTPNSDDKNNKIRALNEKFIAKLVEANKPNAVCDFTAAAKKYIEYYASIQGTTSGSVEIPKVPSIPSKPFSFQPKPAEAKPSFSIPPAPAPTPAAPVPTPAAPVPVPTPAAPVPVPTPAAPRASEPTSAPAKSAKRSKPASDSESESEDDIKVEGPKFTLNSKPTVKNSPFSFGPKPEKKKDDSDSESEVEIKGPTFNFNKPIKDSVFKLSAEPKTTPFTFGATNKEEEKKEEKKESKETSKPFSFGTTNTTDSKPFSFGNSTSFASTTTAKDSSKPTFNFGATSTTTTENTEKPAFSFSATTEKSENSEKPAVNIGTEKPTVSFGSTEKPSVSFGSTEKPAISFGNSTDKPAVNFGSTEKPKFSFGSTEKPSVNFGTTSGNDTSKPLFNFGASTEKTKPAFSFGTKNDTNNKEETQKVEGKEKPAFSFNLAKSTPNPDAPNPFSFNFKGNDKDTPKPFSFGSNDKKEDAPKPFSFGEKKEDAKPFSFGEKKEDAKPFSFGEKKEGTISFGSTDAPKPFSFGSNAFGASNTAPTNSTKNDKEEEDKVPEEETGGDFEPVVKLNADKIESPSTGEEDEEVLYGKRTKLMLFNPENKDQPYANKGLGDLKVLKNKDTEKSRILIRADGGLRVLLNTAVSSNFKYDTIGNGSMVRVPTVNPADKKLETFVLKVKTPEDGAELLDVLNAAKK